MILGASAYKNGIRTTTLGRGSGAAAAPVPERRDSASGDEISAQARALGVPSVDVRSGGKALKGCRAADGLHQHRSPASTARCGRGGGHAGAQLPPLLPSRP
jgi:hypothetical protein